MPAEFYSLRARLEVVEGAILLLAMQGVEESGELRRLRHERDALRRLLERLV